MKYKGLALKEACDFLMNEELKDVKGDIGFIAVDPSGNHTFQYNSERMHRAWKTSDNEEAAYIYRE
jgi:beta-aspartyl-peptidase (threonine type)